MFFKNTMFKQYVAISLLYIFIIFGLPIVSMTVLAKKVNTSDKSRCKEEVDRNGFLKKSIDTTGDGKINVIIYEKDGWVIAFSDAINHDLFGEWHVSIQGKPLFGYDDLNQDHKIDNVTFFATIKDYNVGFFDRNGNGKFDKWLIVDPKTESMFELWDDNGDLIPDRWKVSKSGK